MIKASPRRDVLAEWKKEQENIAVNAVGQSSVLGSLEGKHK